MKVGILSLATAILAFFLIACSAMAEDWIKPQQAPVTKESAPRAYLPQKISACWNVGSLSTEASGMSVLVKVRFDWNASPIPSGITFEGYKDGSEAAARQAFEAARRAILRCDISGYDLPREYRYTSSIELVFSPAGVKLQ